MNAFLLAALTGVLFFLAVGSGLEILFRLAYVAAGALVLAFVWTRLSLRGVALERRVGSSRSQVGDRVEETITVANRSWLPKAWIALYDHSSLPNHNASRVVSLGARSRVTWRVETICAARGRFRLGPSTLRAGDPFGVFERRLALGKPSTIVVYPATAPLPGFPLPGGALLGGTNRRQRTDQITPNAAGIREYVPGDAFSRIHWPSSARTNRLMVKEFEPDPIADLWIALDMEAAVQAGSGAQSTEEYAVHAAASIARRFLTSGWAVGLLSCAEQHHDLPPERGDRQLMKMLEELAVIRAIGRTPLGEVLISEGVRFGRRATVIAITPSPSQVWVAALRTFVERGVRSLAVLIDAGSFGGAAIGEDTLVSLAAAGIPTYIYRRGDSLADVFLGKEASPIHAGQARAGRGGEP